MKIVCLIKFVPDLDNFTYDYERNVLVRENAKLVLNPDDACALAFALDLKAKRPETVVEIVAMAPGSVLPLVEDLLRRKADRATIISDRLFAGSDTYATSKIIASYLKKTGYDLILTGTRSVDGDTSHVPSQIAELLDLEQLSHIVKIHEVSPDGDTAIVDADTERCLERYEIELPCILSLSSESKYKLPYVRYRDLKLDVRDRITVLDNEALGVPESETGLKGSMTRVKRTFTAAPVQEKKRIVVRTDEKGIETVYQFLKYKGFV